MAPYADIGLSRLIDQESAAYRAAWKDNPMLARLFKHTVWVVFVLLVLIGLSIHGFMIWRHVESERWGQLLEVLADGLIVAGVLGATVDWALKRALIRDVGSIFIGWSLPQAVRNYIRDVSQTAIVRRHCRLHYVFRLNGQEVIIDVTDDCDVYNFSTGLRRYRPQLGIDVCENPDPVNIESAVSVTSGASIGESPTCSSVTATAVTTFVRVPIMA